MLHMADISVDHDALNPADDPVHHHYVDHWGMQIFDVPANLTNLAGDPQKAILTTSMYVYQQGFKNTSLGYASTLSVMQFLIIAAFSFIALKLIRKKGA